MTAIISSHGELLQFIYANEETIILNKPCGCLAVSDPPHENMYYAGWWRDMPKQPSNFHIFDYSGKQWVDPRSIEQVREQKWSEVKSLRDQLEFGGFEFEGNIYDSDQVSQGRIMGAASAQIDQIWTLANNTTVDLTASQLMQLYQALQMHVAVAHERGRIAREAIQAATTKEQIEAIVF